MKTTATVTAHGVVQANAATGSMNTMAHTRSTFGGRTSAASLRGHLAASQSTSGSSTSSAGVSSPALVGSSASAHSGAAAGGADHTAVLSTEAVNGAVDTGAKGSASIATQSSLASLVHTGLVARVLGAAGAVVAGITVAAAAGVAPMVDLQAAFSGLVGLSSQAQGLLGSVSGHLNVGIGGNLNLP